jgi:hypothetical protein
VRQVNLKARAFLAAYRLSGSVTAAAEAAKIDRTRHYHWLQASEKYTAAFALAREDYVKLCAETVGDIESGALKRAREGVLEPVFYQGIKCGAIRRWPEGTVQFILRAHKPEVYGAKTELSGPDGGPMLAKIEVEFVKAAPPES